MRAILAEAAAVTLLLACGTQFEPGASSESVPTTQEAEVAQAASRIVGTELCASGKTLRVPSQYPTIASALAAAQAGDRVSVAPGTYPECPVLVDGVMLEGSIVNGEPVSTLDGNAGACNPCVICGDATIVHGAAVRGFRIVDSRLIGILLNGSTAVHMSDLVVANSPGTGVRAHRSSFVLEHSRLLGNTFGVRVMRGSEALLVGNEVQGQDIVGIWVQPGVSLADPESAPTKVWLVDNDIHDNGSSGLWLKGKGVTGRGFGNRFEHNGYATNGYGIQITGGAEYVGRRDTAVGNQDHGVSILGCDLDQDGQTLVQEQSYVALYEAALRNNLGQGLAAGCGAIVNLHDSFSTGNPNGAVAASTIELGGQIATAPSSIRARRTVFADNSGWGVVGYDSFLDLGSRWSPGWNSFLSNTEGSIANVSSNLVLAQWNWFGSTDASAIAASVGGSGPVTFVPFLKHAP